MRARRGASGSSGVSHHLSPNIKNLRVSFGCKFAGRPLKPFRRESSGLSGPSGPLRVIMAALPGAGRARESPGNLGLLKKDELKLRPPRGRPRPPAALADELDGQADFVDGNGPEAQPAHPFLAQVEKTRLAMAEKLRPVPTRTSIAARCSMAGCLFLLAFLISLFLLPGQGRGRLQTG